MNNDIVCFPGLPTHATLAAIVSAQDVLLFYSEGLWCTLALVVTVPGYLLETQAALYMSTAQ